MAQFNDSDVGIDRYIGKSGDYLISQSLTGDNIPQSEVLVYESIKQLYYSNYISGSFGEISLASTASFNNDGTITGPIYQTSYENYKQTTLNPLRYFPTSSLNTSSVEIGVIAIPSKLFGDHIKPNSIVIENEVSGSLFDDGEGRIFMYNPTQQKRYVGNVIYQHGIIIITKNIYEGDASISDVRFIDTYISASDNALHFSSSYVMYETQYKITISPDEFNYSLNPSIFSGSDGAQNDFATGSYFQPYITTVGLYNDKFELMAIGKLAKSLPCSRTTDTTILISIDRM